MNCFACGKEMDDDSEEAKEVGIPHGMCKFCYTLAMKEMYEDRPSDPPERPRIEDIVSQGVAILGDLLGAIKGIEAVLRGIRDDNRMNCFKGTDYNRKEKVI
jgi:hypothetical protein